MARFLVKRDRKLGTAPGSLIFIGKQRIEKVILEVLSYDKLKIENKQIKSLKELNHFTNSTHRLLG